MYTVCGVAATSNMLQLPHGWQAPQAVESGKSRPAVLGISQPSSRSPSTVERAPSRRRQFQILPRAQQQQQQRRQSGPGTATSGGVHCVCLNCQKRDRVAGMESESVTSVSQRHPQSRSAHLRRYSLPVEHASGSSRTPNQNRVAWPATVVPERNILEVPQLEVQADGWPIPVISDTKFSETGYGNSRSSRNGVRRQSSASASSNFDGRRERRGDDKGRGYHALLMPSDEDNNASSVSDGGQNIIASVSRGKPAGYSSMSRTDPAMLRLVEGAENVGAWHSQRARDGTGISRTSSSGRRRSGPVQLSGRSVGNSNPDINRNLTQTGNGGVGTSSTSSRRRSVGCYSRSRSTQYDYQNPLGSINSESSAVTTYRRASRDAMVFSSANNASSGRGWTRLDSPAADENSGLWDSAHHQVGCWHGLLAKLSLFVKKLLGHSFGPQTAPSSSPQAAQVAPPSGKRQRGRGLFSSLLCCFRNSNSSNNNNNNNPPPNCQLPSSEDNGSARTSEKYLLPTVRHQDMNKKCVVIDLDETLVHSSFKPINNADFIVPVEIDGTIHQVYVLKRPHVDEFLQRMGEMFECVLFTASLAKYADPVADLLDKWNVFRCRLFRDSCIFHRGNYVKDLSRLGRELEQVVIVDNSPASYIFHPNNAVAVTSWFDEMDDTELLDLIPFFERLERSDNVYSALKFMIEPSPPPQPHQQHPQPHQQHPQQQQQQTSAGS